MMRRLILILGSMVLAAIAFLIYMLWQSPSGPAIVDTHLTPTSVQSSQNMGGVGAGQGVWIKQYDKDGNLTSILSAKRYVPREGGNVVDVIEPQAEFFLAGGRKMILTGDRGVINVEQRPSANKSSMGSSETAPTSGFLYNVVVRVFEQSAPDRAVLTMNTNNISFDNQTLKFATEKFTDSYGQPVNADMVPVIIRGDDIDFDGKGLKARYDDLNKRIATLEITHGDQMTIKRSELLPKSMDTKSKDEGGRRKDEKGANPASATQAASAASPSLGTPGEGGGEGSVAKAPAPAVAAKTVTLTTKAAATNPAGVGPTIYRATFLDEVRITQGDAPLADADTLAIEFFPLQGKHDSTTKPATRPTPTTVKTTKPATTQVASTNPTTSPSTQATTAATSQPAPVILRWKGTLRLVAIDQPSAPLAGGESIVTAVGTPLVLHQPQGVVRCGSAMFHSRENSVLLKTGEKADVVAFDSADNNAHVRTQELSYSDAGKTAVLTGPSELRMTQPKQSNTPAMETIATWKDRCTIAMFDTPGNAVKQIDLTGNVVINNPQLKSKSSAMSLAFKPDAKDKEKSVLNTITATGGVDADLSDPDHLYRKLRGEKVVVTTMAQPDGNLFPTQISASGSAEATDEDQSINADNLDITLKPATTRPAGLASSKPATQDPSSDLQTFKASGSVIVLGNDDRALADTITVDRTSGHPIIELRGKPASLTQQGRTLTGPVIIARPDDGYAMVDGAGTLHAIETGVTKVTAATTKPTTRATTRPIDLAWAGGADLDAGKNLITFRDKVVINTVETDGTRRQGTGDLLTVTLKNAPATQPTKKASTTPAKKSTTQPADQFKDKVVSAITLSGNVNVTSELDSPSGDLLKRTFLRTEKLSANLDDAQQLSSIDIPGPGQALIDDRSPQKPKDKNSGGATAIDWKKSFRLDQGAAPTATLLGDVWIHHDPAGGPGDDSVDLKSSKVVVNFEPESKKPTTKPVAATKPATTKATTKPSSNFALGIRQVYAAAPVQFKARDVEVSAQSLQFTPDTHMVLISGNDRQPVEVINLKAQTRGQFQQAWYDTELGMIVRSTGVSVQGGK